MEEFNDVMLPIPPSFGQEKKPEQIQQRLQMSAELAKDLEVVPSPSFVKGVPAAGTEAKIKKQSAFQKIMKNMQGRSNEYGTIQKSSSANIGPIVGYHGKKPSASSRNHGGS